MPAKTYRHTHRVTYAECTMGNHIYYARYLDILESARGEFFRFLGVSLLDLQARDTVFPVIECRLSYKAPARYDDVLNVELLVNTLERVRLKLGYRVFSQSGKLILEASTSHVCATIAEKPKRLPDELAELLAPYLDPGID